MNSEKGIVSMKPVKLADLDHTPLIFGKYVFRTPDQIAEDDPEYIVWMYREWQNSGKPPPCSKLLYDACREELDDNPREDLFFDSYDIDPDLGDR